tara:strand:+ start:7926 stop:8522 length:597 start_codon:yes stop_codon:yes gene_type:complete
VTSDVDICNLALQRLGTKAISALNEDSTAGRECNRVYAHARDSEIRNHPWSFARARASLAADAVAPIFGYALRFQLPAGFIRLLPVRNVATNSLILGGIDPGIDWQIEGRYILTDDGAPLQIVYLQQITDPNEFDQLFTDLLVSRIAMDVAEKVTQSNTKKQNAELRYTDAMMKAKKANAFERPPQEFPADDWVVARV